VRVVLIWIDGRVAPRSGLAYKHGIDTLAGVIDADYRGPVGVILANLSDVDFEVKVGDRIAQLIVEKVCHTRNSWDGGMRS
jgi:dUTP pyrophosphatase